MVSKPSYRARLATYLVSITLFIVIAAGAVLLTRGYSLGLKTGIEKTGLVVLDSAPKNAFVTLNNRLQPAKTRTTLKLAPGTYDLKVDMPGVHPWQKHVRVEPGEADLEEDILLFLTAPKRADLTAGAVPGQALSPSGKELAFLNPGAAGPTLTTIPVAQHDPARSVAGLPAPFSAPRSFAWSADGSRVVLSTDAETRIVATDGHAVAIPAGGRVALAPGANDQVVAENLPGQLVLAGSTGAPQAYDNEVTAWVGTGDAVFASRTNGDLVRHGNGTDRRVVSQGHTLVDVSASPENHRVFGRDAGGTVYWLDGSALRTAVTGADRYAVSRDGDQVTYLRQRELRLWDKTDGSDVLLTRFTDPPEQLAIVPGGHYVLYVRGGELHAIAADGSNDTALAAGLDLIDVIDRENVLVRDRASGRTVTLTILER